VYLLRGAGGYVLVDTGFPGNTRLILKRIAARGVKLQQLRLILISHGHIDHLCCARELRETLQVPIAIHAADAAVPVTGKMARLQGATWLGHLTVPFCNLGWIPTKYRFRPDIVFAAADMSLAEYGVEGKLLHTPGHTPGSVSILMPDGAIYAGDAILPWFPFLRRPSYSLYTTDRETMVASAHKILDSGAQMIYCGHGGPLSATSVAQWYRHCAAN
jgi:glyoxylase-like metal-dependent hydrolase (beta-lactamase superfamily II)